ncbi:IS1/IS1595 family N-terminal zinc-binding domain-containing protein [Budvicia diplopodorum]|uniref:IS1/IS1595 family N-terminal zinc-binding domain-containing protein n=1 Tax=Budvicia diplopodorum TaxID=1119056 RepID=UPI00135ABA69|nr:hypothetical protein [Budvicia diplopodorum]
MKDNPSACHHCDETNSVRKHGKARSGIQRYYCSACRKTFQVKYLYQGNEDNILEQVKKGLNDGGSRVDISRKLGVEQSVVDRHIYILTMDSSA